MVTAKQQHHHPVEWRAPGPLWSLALQDGAAGRLFAPQLLRFDVDEFMASLTAALAAENEPNSTAPKLKDLILRHETWEAPAVGWQPLAQAQTGPTPKLFHPAHARFYLVAASLVCKLPGLPDRAPHGEKVTFVLRQLRPTVTQGLYQEEGWVPGQGWVVCTDPLKLLAGEEQQPLFPVGYTGDGKARRLHCGLVPVASREVQKPTGAQAFPIPQVTGKTPEGWSALEKGEEDPRLVQLRAQVLAPLGALPLATFSTTEAYEASAFILYDLAVFLRDQLPAVWAKVQSGNGTGSTLATEILTKTVGAVTWATALKTTLTKESALLTGGPTGLTYDLRSAQPIDWAVRVPAEIPTYVPPTSLPEGTLTQVPKFMPNGKERFVIRCVYQKPNCKLHDAQLSQPTRPFKLASFFDPDAPVRPVKVVMPTDTSIAGLRRFQKGVSFVVSNKLRNQMEKFRGIKMSDLDDGSLGSSSAFDWGMICSFSIPIITICALILLFIIVQLLNIVFFWVPFLKICFPVPLPAKEEA
ncbi:MAG TPA: hypothetical protein VK191_08595 [Symbiobacteriaceae bacterium]|nr:hypothetical protein [Symbiobacteriaceae bacterium]